jgi:hypothetical protein
LFLLAAPQMSGLPDTGSLPARVLLLRTYRTYVVRKTARMEARQRTKTGFDVSPCRICITSTNYRRTTVVPVPYQVVRYLVGTYQYQVRTGKSSCMGDVRDM